MTDFPDIGYGTVHGRFLAGVLDSPDSGVAPDAEPLSGFVTFAPTASVIAVVSAAPPATFFPQPLTVKLDEQGRLSLDGSNDISLWATDDQSGNPYNWQWRVTFNLHHEGRGVFRAPFNFELPMGSIIDLTVVAPVVTPSPGTIIIQGPMGPPGASVTDLITAKGDMVAGTGFQEAAIISVGADGEYLTPDPVAETGLAWKPLPEGVKSYADKAEMLAVRTAEVGTLHVDNLAAAFPELANVQTWPWASTGPADMVVTTSLSRTTGSTDYWDVVQQIALGDGSTGNLWAAHRIFQWIAGTPDAGDLFKLAPRVPDKQNERVIYGDSLNPSWGTKAINYRLIPFESAIVTRNAYGNAEIADPTNPLDIVNKRSLEGAIEAWIPYAGINQALIGVPGPDGPVWAWKQTGADFTPDSFMLRGVDGTSQIADPADPLDIVNLQTLEDAIGAIPPPALPARLGEFAHTVLDWNLAVTDGWYFGANALNNPMGSTSQFIGMVTARDALYVKQEVTDFLVPHTVDSTSPGPTPYVRYLQNGVWSAWRVGGPTDSRKMYHIDGGTAYTIDPANGTLDNRLVVMMGGTLAITPKRHIFVRDPIWVYNASTVEPTTITTPAGGTNNGMIPPGKFARIDYSLGSLGPQVENNKTWVTIMGNPTAYVPGIEVHDNPTFTAVHSGTVPFMNRATQTITLADLSPLVVMPAPIHLKIGVNQTATLTSTMPIHGPTTIVGATASRFVDLHWYKGVWIVDDPAVARLSGFAQTITDWDTAVENGWYMAQNSVTAPEGGWWMGIVSANSAAFVVQEVINFTSATPKTYRRQRINSVWQPWVRIGVDSLLAPPLTFLDVAAGAHYTPVASTPGIIRADGAATIQFSQDQRSYIVRHTAATNTTRILFQGGAGVTTRGPAYLSAGDSVLVDVVDAIAHITPLDGVVIRKESRISGAVSIGESLSGYSLWANAATDVTLVTPTTTTLAAPIYLQVSDGWPLTFTGKIISGPTSFPTGGMVMLDFTYNGWVITPLGGLGGAPLPARLGALAQTITDWNLAVENGWYMAGDAANGPAGATWWIGTVSAHNPAYVVQEVINFNSATPKTYRRQLLSGAWQPWVQTLETITDLDARYASQPLPARIGPVGATITDWNQATADGWYMADAALNAPPATPYGGGWRLGWVVAHRDTNPIHVIQEVSTFNHAPTQPPFVYRRHAHNGVWGQWERIYKTAAEISTVAAGKYAGVTVVSAATYTPTIADVGKLIVFTSLTPVTVTLSGTLGFAVGSQIDFVQKGTGQVTFTSPDVVQGVGLATRAQFSAVTAVVISGNEWLVVGDLA